MASRSRLRKIPNRRPHGLFAQLRQGFPPREIHPLSREWLLAFYSDRDLIPLARIEHLPRKDILDILMQRRIFLSDVLPLTHLSWNMKELVQAYHKCTLNKFLIGLILLYRFAYKPIYSDWFFQSADNLKHRYLLNNAAFRAGILPRENINHHMQGVRGIFLHREWNRFDDSQVAQCRVFGLTKEVYRSVLASPGVSDETRQSVAYEVKGCLDDYWNVNALYTPDLATTLNHLSHSSGAKNGLGLEFERELRERIWRHVRNFDADERSIMNNLEDLSNNLGRKPSPAEVWGFIVYKRLVRKPVYTAEILAAITDGNEYRRIGCTRDARIPFHPSLFQFMDTFFPKNPQGRAEFLMKAQDRTSHEFRCLAHSIQLDKALELCKSMGWTRRQEKLLALGCQEFPRKMHALLNGWTSFERKTENINKLSKSELRDLKKSFGLLAKRYRHVFLDGTYDEWNSVVERIKETLLQSMEIHLDPKTPFVMSRIYEEWVELPVFYDEGQERRFSVKVASDYFELAQWGSELRNCLGNLSHKLTFLGIYDNDNDAMFGVAQISDSSLAFTEAQIVDNNKKLSLKHAMPDFAEHLYSFLFQILVNECGGIKDEEKT